MVLFLAVVLMYLEIWRKYKWGQWGLWK